MDWDWEREWSAFQDRCLSELRGSSRQRESIARFWYLPAFEPCLFWSIQQSEADPYNHIVRRTTWDRTRDGEKFSPRNPLEQLKTKVNRTKGNEPTPTITVDELSVPVAPLNAVLAQGYSICIPVYLEKDKRIGLDGVTFGFSSGTNMRSSTIEWWGDGPKEWQPFIAWWHHLQEFIEGHFDSI